MVSMLWEEDVSKQANLGNKGANWKEKGIPEKAASSDWKM